MPASKSGFTLVELSIVLVIIGLLLGGILAAQSMIQTAKVNRLVNDLTQYEIAIRNFTLSFKSIPGDSPQFMPPGDGDGALSIGPVTPGYSNAESTQSWGHLYQAGMINKNYPGYSPISSGGTHADLYTSAENAGILWPYNTIYGDAAVYIGRSRIAFEFGKIPPESLKITSFINPIEMMALENKMGVKDYLGEQGLINSNGAGTCFDITEATVSCSDASAVFNELQYRFGI